jgi:phenylacetate-coenzyme A ligase PaaK-like adenylate-forming protein
MRNFVDSRDRAFTGRIDQAETANSMNWKKWLEGAWWLLDFADRANMSRASRARLEASQRRKFRRLVRHAWRHSTYYRSLMNARNLDPETCRVGDFPEMTKQDLIDRFDEIVTDRRLSLKVVRQFHEQNDDPTALLDDRYYVVRTSGSSSQIGYLAYTAREWIRGCSHHLRFAPGMRLRKRSAWVGCAGHFAGVTVGLTGRRGINQLFYDCRMFDVRRPLAELVVGLNAFQPHLLSGYAAALNLIAQEQAEGRLRLTPQRVVNSGEPLPIELRRFLEREFRAPVSNLYSATETLFMGAADNAGEGMCLYEDDLIFEIFDHHTCVTNLFNWTTPLIRYRLNDALVLQDGGPAAKGPFRRIQEIVGRCERLLLFRNNHGLREFVHPVHILVLDIPNVPFFQLRLLGEREFLFRVQLRCGLSATERQEALAQTHRQLTRVLADKNLEQSVSFRVEVVPSFASEQGRGKFKVIEFAEGAARERAAA